MVKNLIIFFGGVLVGSLVTKRICTEQFEEDLEEIREAHRSVHSEKKDEVKTEEELPNREHKETIASIRESIKNQETTKTAYHRMYAATKEMAEEGQPILTGHLVIPHSEYMKATGGDHVTLVWYGDEVMTYADPTDGQMVDENIWDEIFHDWEKELGTDWQLHFDDPVWSPDPNIVYVWNCDSDTYYEIISDMNPYHPEDI